MLHIAAQRVDVDAFHRSAVSRVVLVHPATSARLAQTGPVGGSPQGSGVRNDLYKIRNHSHRLLKLSAALASGTAKETRTGDFFFRSSKFDVFVAKDTFSLKRVHVQSGQVEELIRLSPSPIERRRYEMIATQTKATQLMLRSPASKNASERLKWKFDYSKERTNSFMES